MSSGAARRISGSCSGNSSSTTRAEKDATAANWRSETSGSSDRLSGGLSRLVVSKCRLEGVGGRRLEGAGGRVRRPPNPLRPAGCRCRVRVGGLAGLGGERYPVGVRDAPRSAAFSPPDPSLSRRRTTLERVQAAEVITTRSSTEVNRLKPLVFSDLIDVSDSFFVKTFSFICNIL